MPQQHCRKFKLTADAPCTANHFSPMHLSMPMPNAVVAATHCTRPWENPATTALRALAGMPAWYASHGTPRPRSAAATASAVSRLWV